MATITYKCPNCGGGLRFDPKLQKFKCDFCLSEFTQEELEKLTPQQAGDQTVSEEEAAYLGQKEKEPSTEGKNEGQTGAVLYTCPSCGATVITDETTAATFCYYCHNPIVLEGKLSGKYLPDRLIPFKYDKKKAEEIFLDYVHHKRFVPKAFFTKDQVEKLSGVYYPFWVYHASVDGQMSAAANRIRTWVTGDMEYTETRVFHVERGGQIDIQNLSRNALQESDKNLINWLSAGICCPEAGHRVGTDRKRDAGQGKTICRACSGEDDGGIFSCHWKTIVLQHKVGAICIHASPGLAADI